MKQNSLSEYYKESQNITSETQKDICQKIGDELEKIFEGKCKISHPVGKYQTVSFIIKDKFEMGLHLSHGLCIVIEGNIQIVRSLTLDRIEIYDDNYRGVKNGQKVLEILEEIAKDYGYLYIAATVVLSKEMEHILVKNDFVIREGSSYTNVGFDYYKKIQSINNEI